MSWETVQIKDVCKKVTSGGTPLTSKENYYFPRQIPWIKTKEVNYCRITDAETYISQEGLDNSSAKLIPVNSVIVAMYGQGDTAGRVAINKIPVATNQACCNLIVDETKADYRFIYYKLSTLYEKLVSLKNGGAQPNLNAAIIKSLEIDIPTLKVQHKIADMISAYDDLIENNQKQIKLLEEATQRLYKEWFVDLHFPGHESTAIIDGVPEGWKECAIVDLCEKINAGGTPSRRNASYWNDASIKWYKTQELQDCWLIDSSEKISVAGQQKSSAKFFPENTILMAIYASPTLGRLGILDSEATCNQAALCLKADEEKISWQWLYEKLYELRDYYNGIARGAGQQNISGDVVKQTMVLCPSKEIIDRFTNIVSPMFEKRRLLQKQVFQLTEARDRLLPKLMSGEIEV